MKTLTEMTGEQIKALWYPAAEEGSWVAGQRGCKSITLYNEHGEMAAVPYAQVLLDSGREFRVNVKAYDVELLPVQKEAELNNENDTGKVLARSSLGV